jgi:hypothetical protein
MLFPRYSSEQEMATFSRISISLFPTIQKSFDTNSSLQLTVLLMEADSVGVNPLYHMWWYGAEETSHSDCTQEVEDFIEILYQNISVRNISLHFICASIHLCGGRLKYLLRIVGPLSKIS